MDLPHFDFVILQAEAELNFTSGTEHCIYNWEKCGHPLGTGGQDTNIPDLEFSRMPNKTKQNKTTQGVPRTHLSLSVSSSRFGWWPLVGEGGTALHLKHTKLRKQRGFQPTSEASRCYCYPPIKAVP